MNNTLKKATIALLAMLCIMACGDETAFTDPRDGKKYKTVKIGTQTWMAENLNYEAEGSKCYENNPDNCAKYGRLYNWKTAMKVCPKGWHLPDDDEWDELYRFLDMQIRRLMVCDDCYKYYQQKMMVLANASLMRNIGGIQ